MSKRNKMIVNTIEAIFIREEKHRFLGVIYLNGKEELCYVPSSSKLSKYFNVNNKPALVIPIENKTSRTRYRLLAVEVENEWIIVDLNILNLLMKENYEKIGYLVKQEQKTENGYRTDLIVEKEYNSIMIEIKGIISLNGEALVPFNSGERAIRQLHSIYELLKNDKYEVEYAFIILSNCVKNLSVNKNQVEYKKAFTNCIENGMKVNVYRIRLISNEISIVEDSSVNVEW